MDDPLWTDAHPPDLEDIPQDEARTRLLGAVEEPMNLLLYGPRGCGKTAAARALARRTHADPDNDLVEINVADFFDRTKTEITNDPRFESFLRGRSDLPKRDMINRVLRESASYAPVSGTYKTVLLDNAEGIREDFQQALRRVMERYHRTTQFVIATRQPTRLIPPIRSRCFPVSMRAPTEAEIVSVLEEIAEAEGAEYETDGLKFVAGYAEGDLRRAILAAETVHAAAGAITMQDAYEVLDDVGLDDRVEAMLDATEAGNFSDARSELDDLLVDEGLSGEEVLDEFLGVAHRRYSGDRLARIYERAGQTDFDLQEGTGERIHLAHLLAVLSTD
jgi:replication factor C small subunit